MKALKITAVVLALGFIGLVVYAVASPHDETKVEHDDRANYLHKQETQILFVLRRAGTSFADNITLTERTDSEGNYYYIGEINPELDSCLKDLVDAYNADPETTLPITLEELRYCLTDGLAEETELGTHESNFRHFLKWCGVLVDIMHNNGSLKYPRSTMFGYVKDKDTIHADCYIVMRPRP